MAGFMPTVKCSDCGIRIEISLMGDHICNTYPQAIPPSEPDHISEERDPIGNRDNERGGGGFLKPGRPGPPPRIDPSAANRPFLRPHELLTPASSSGGSQVASPISPLRGPTNSYRQLSRSMTSPQPRSSPPSPAYSNLDCAFPPFPTSGSRGGTPVDDTRGLFSAFEDGLGISKGESSGRSGSFSRPRGLSISSAQRRTRGNTLANSLDPIPRPSTAGSNRRKPSLTSNYGENAVYDHELPPLPALPALGSQLNRGYGVRNERKEAQRADGYGTIEMEAPPFPQMTPYQASSVAPAASTHRQPPLNNPRHFKPYQRPLASPTRSQTFPIHEESKNLNDGPNRRPSEPSPSSRTREQTIASRNGQTTVEPTTNIYQPFRGPNVPPQSTKRFPPRMDSRATRAMGKYGVSNDDVAPILPAKAFVDELDIGNPYHTASESASSNNSEVSAAATLSSQSSISLSPPRRKPSSKPGNLELPSVPPLSKYHNFPDSPTDPLFQEGRLSPIPPVNHTPPPVPRFASPDSMRRPPTRSGTNKGTCRGCSNMILAGEKSVSSADGRLTGRYHKSCFVCHDCREPFVTADFYVLENSPYCSKHYHEANGSLCCGCREGIEGQYLEAETEKATTLVAKISEPEKPSMGKFHPTCFTCETCKIMLSEDYFTFNSKNYCERDAFVAAGMGSHSKNSSISSGASSQHSRGHSRSGSRAAAVNRANGLLAPGMGYGTSTGGRRFPERRTTKLMMI